MNSNSSLRSYLKKYFWGDNFSSLNLKDHKNYILKILLEIGNQDAIYWLFSNFSKKEIKQVLPSLKLTPKSKNYWQICL